VGRGRGPGGGGGGRGRGLQVQDPLASLAAGGRGEVVGKNTRQLFF